MKKKELILITPNVFSIENFRGDLLREYRKLNYNLTAVSNGSKDIITDFINELDIDYYEMEFNNTGLNIFRDFGFILKLRRLIKKKKPDIILLFTVKPVFYVSILSSLLKVQPRVYSFITGLGFVFTGSSSSKSGIKKRAVQSFVKFIYKISFRFNRKIYVQNEDDYNFFIDNKIIKDNSKLVITNGSGVNVKKFDFNGIDKKPQDSKINFLFVGRLLKSKGISEFIEACRILKERYSGNISFTIAGIYDDTNIDKLDRDTIDYLKKGDLFEFYIRPENLKELYSRCSVFVFPSYREGTPRSVLEAMAMGKPVITTNVPGCRQTIIDDHNGILVEPRNSGSLVKAMERFINSPGVISVMGKRSREIAVDKYDVNKVNRLIVKETISDE